MSALQPIPVGWASTGETGAQNYDEFADDAEITALVAANPDSMLGVEMPHRTPEAVAAGLDFAAALPAASARLASLVDTGKLAAFTDAIAVYRIGDRFLGMFCLVDTAEIAAGPGAPGRVIRNEEVFAAKVAERTALIQTLATLTSPVLLVQADGDALHEALADVVAESGEPDATDVDQHGLTHAIWLVGPGPDRDRLLAAADTGELVVADGNHRSLAAQQAGLTRFLAVVAPAGSVSIQPYQRLLRQLPMPVPEILDGLRASGAGVRSVDGRPATPPRGTVVLYADGQTYEVTLPPAAGSAVDRLDHTVVEQLLIRHVLGLTPDHPAISYIGGDYPAGWLAAEVDADRAALAVLLAPVTVEDFVEVNLDRATMPRKSTWFTPKARTGLVLADVHEDLGAISTPDVQPEALSR
ncbi:DUF1015 family protein [Cryptosporangium aurantiacum]|uniref:Uncharacterized conserved protein, DUF1015 family n=1 Tax=Cryptosporangium aurantiacum TaxID=134849 RepID=A0A1M7Q969_9ACTN|nr:DUF1015 family protein [Cryptosporangium aurantiacum]SHN26829.1 Uncharacterized conserved protein, DUF1015 family [Cryptosporangium aurantiacum]